MPRITAHGLRASEAVDSRDTKEYLEHIVKRATRHRRPPASTPALGRP